MQNDSVNVACQSSASGPEPLQLSRRFFVLAAPAILTTACTPAMHSAGSYGTVSEGRVTLPAMDTSNVNPRWLRQTVAYAGGEAPGTIVVRPSERHLYFVTGRGTAIRYGVGVGRPGFSWGGNQTITRKAEWPDWRPPAQMLRRRPDLPRFMAGGPDNPLGARAMYLGSSLYRIHGSNEPHTIGTAVSSGCFRLTNDDVIDLYSRVRVGTRVVVLR